MPPLPLDPLHADGRWQRGTVIGALYLADCEATAWAEWYRQLGEAGVSPPNALPRELWRIRLNAEVADLSTQARLNQVGLERPQPTRRAWPRFQAVGESLWRAGWLGVMAPSAARPRGRVACVFADRAEACTRPVGRPTLVREPPVPPRGMTT